MRGLHRLKDALDAQSDPIAITPATMPDHARQAAVLILLTDADDPFVMLIERAATLRKHAGQIAFPGGAVDPGDADPASAALRETAEEIGLERSHVTVLGHLPTAWVPVSGFAVTPVVGTWTGNVAVRAAQASEVAAVHAIGLATLSDPLMRACARHQGGYVGPAFVIEDLFIWGFTAHLLSRVLDLGGWSVPWDNTRVLDVPRRFQRDRKIPI